MGVRTWRERLSAAVVCGALISPALVDAQGQGTGPVGSVTLVDRYGAADDRMVLATQRGRGARANRSLVLRSTKAGVNPYTTGYERGYERGVDDGRQGDRYDPVRHRDYRDGDEGYSDDYGSRDAYRNNYRAGFRQGYEEGYRQGSRNRR